MPDPVEENFPLAIPTPADPVRRRTPLPGEHPSPHDLHPERAAMQRAIMEHPSYAPADHDLDLLNTPGLRGVRLQLDYLKAERGMAEQGIGHCVVVFGSTRLHEPESAKRALEVAKRNALAEPHAASSAHAVARAESRVRLSTYYEVGRKLGRLIAESGNGPEDLRVVVMTGGGPGAMEAANRGASEAGAKTVGLNITLPREQYPNPYITPGLCFQFHYFALRKLHFMSRAVALVALPGGFGTLDELFGALTLIQTRKMPPIPVVLIGESYWKNLINISFLVESGTIDPEDAELLWFAETAQQAWTGIQTWYQRAGKPLFGA
jgi:uncharacterized protein (TIGR00730 family)